MNRRKELIRAVKFTLFSISAGVIQLVSGAFFSMVLGWEEYWSYYLPSLLLSVIWNFTFNRKFTFRSANNVPVAMAKALAFYVVFTPLSTWGGDALVANGWNGAVVFIGTMVLNFILEFMYDRFVVFGASIDTAVKE